VTGSSGAASDDPHDMTAESTAGPWRRAAARFPAGAAVLALVVGGMVAVMYASHRSGHWWGDDWALYIRQAQGLLDADPGRVFDENRFAIEASRGAPFSPTVYPWGFPALLSPAVAIVGADVDRLTIVPASDRCSPT